MSLVDESLAAVLSVQLKPRHDALSDQYSRFFMNRMMVLMSALVGVTYYTDNIDCVITNTNGAGADFIGSTCWIQGFYIFEEMRSRISESGFYGIPRNMDYDGLDERGNLCTTENRAGDVVEGCTPMTKLYYLQYQYMLFFFAILSLVFYLPYILWKSTNGDMLDLKQKETTGDLENDAQEIMDTYFDHNANNRRRMQIRTASTLCVKFCYLLSNAMSFYFCDAVLMGRFVSYGTEYMRWLALRNFEMFEHDLRMRGGHVKPADQLLPPMGLCDIHEASRDSRNTHINEHRLICELSPHVLHQYVFLVTWFLLIIGLVVSSLGIVTHLVTSLYNYMAFNRAASTRALASKLVQREITYLALVREKNKEVFVKLVKKLNDVYGTIDSSSKRSSVGEDSF